MRLFQFLKKRFNKKPLSLDEFYANDPAYQDFNKEYKEHCRDSGLHGEERTLVANLVTSSYYAFKEGHTPEQLLTELEEKLQALIKNCKNHAAWLKENQPDSLQEENPDLTAISPGYAVGRIISSGQSLIYYWEEEKFYDSLPLLEDCLTNYFNQLALNKTEK